MNAAAVCGCPVPFYVSPVKCKIIKSQSNASSVMSRIKINNIVNISTEKIAVQIIGVQVDRYQV